MGRWSRVDHLSIYWIPNVSFFFLQIRFSWIFFSGKETIKRILELSSEQRQVPFLVRKEALRRCSIWGKFLSVTLALVE